MNDDLFIKIIIYLDNNFRYGSKMNHIEKEIYQYDIVLNLLKNLLKEDFKDFYIKFCNHFNLKNDYELNQKSINENLIDLKEKINCLNSAFLNS